jgi:DeoR family transcriptional regulator of aga operon
VMLKRAGQVVAVADSSKLGATALARICGCDELDRLITTAGAGSDELDAIAALGVDVEVV